MNKLIVLILSFLLLGFLSGRVFAMCGMSGCETGGHKHEEKKEATKDVNKEKVHKHVYACPKEGCSYTSDKPGKCIKCKDKQKLIKKEIYYECPKCGMKFDKPGKCTMDDETLIEKTKPVEKKKKEKQHEHH